MTGADGGSYIPQSAIQNRQGDMAGKGGSEGDGPGGGDTDNDGGGSGGRARAVGFGVTERDGCLPSA